MSSTLFFQYCQKLIILSADKQSVLLAKRKGEADYDGIYSFIGGKMETTDATLLAGMQREKNEEIGSQAIVRVLPNESYNLYFTKKDGSHVVLPHIAGIFVNGPVTINDEYSNYAWIPLSELEAFTPKIDNIPLLAAWALQKVSAAANDQWVRI